MVKGKILIVDDDPVARDVLSEILARVGGYGTDIAIDGFEGIEKVRNNNYDIIFTDLTMPRLNGMDLLRETRKIAPSIPVIVVTAFSSIDNAVNAMKEGARDFITKPFKINTVTSLTDKILGERKLFDRLTSGNVDEASMARLNSELFKNLMEVGMLQSLSTELDLLLDNREIYEKIVEMASRLLVVKEVSFGIIENGVLKIERAIGAVEKDITISGTILEKVVADKNYYIGSPGELSPYDGSPLKSQFLSIPFIMNGEAFGILSLSDKADSTVFADNEISLAVTFAKKAALRIENNALYEVFYNNLVNTLKSLVASIEARDIYTKHHSERVSLYSMQIAEMMDLGEDEKDIIRFGGYLHDVGKIGVRDTVLLKPGRLTDEEMAEIKMHPVVGDNIIKPIKFFPRERELIRSHHERYDGKGYPDGIAGEDIPLIVRVLTVADTFDAMTSSRPYRTARTHEFAVEELKRCSGTQFDPEVVKAFLMTTTGKGKTDDTE